MNTKVLKAPSPEGRPHPGGVIKQLRVKIDYSELDIGDSGNDEYPELALTVEQARIVDEATPDEILAHACDLFNALLTRLKAQLKPQLVTPNPQSPEQGWIIQSLRGNRYYNETSPEQLLTEAEMWKSLAAFERGNPDIQYRGHHWVNVEAAGGGELHYAFETGAA